MARIESLLVRMPARVVVTLIALAVAAVGVAWNTWTAGGSDSYGYVSEAQLWLSGHLRVEQPWMRQVPWPNAEWTFTPLGYAPGLDHVSLVPKYSPGLPMLMAVAQAIAGHRAVFLVGPLSGAALMLATYGIARRVGSPRAGMLAVWLLATSPILVNMVVQPMSDVPVAAAWAVALWCLLGESLTSAIVAGLAGSIAVLIRPNLVPMAGVMGLWLAYRLASAGHGEQRLRTWRLLTFGACLVPGVLGIAALNQVWHGAPGRSGYGDLGGMFALTNMPVHAGRFVRWVTETQTPIAFIGVAALFVPARRIWTSAIGPAAAILFATLAVVVAVEHFSYAVFDDWSYLRFFLPVWPLMLIALALVLARAASLAPRVGIAVVVVAALAIGGHGIKAAGARYAFDWQRAESKYPVIGDVVRTRTPPHAVVLSVQHSGSVRYYGGRMTLTYASLDPAWLDRTIEWLDQHGSHPYAVLEDWEVREFRARFGQANTIGRLAMTPMVYYEPEHVYVYDLLRAADSRDPMELIERPGPVRCADPAPPPTVEFKS
jgi:hypothetical protein